MPIIISILNNIAFVNFYENNYLTPFNRYILDKIQKLITFFDNVCEVTLPPFIEQLINDNLPKDYKYDYFNENPEEDFVYKNICFNIDELYCLVYNADKFKDEININKDILSRLYNKELIKIKNSLNSEINKEKNKKVIKYFLLTSFINNENLNKIIEIKNCYNQYFNIKELKKIKTNTEKTLNDIIKVKNLFCALLYNYPNLSKYNYKNGNYSNIINILKELKNSIYINSTFYTNNNPNHINWYIDTIIHYLSLLPQNFLENDCKQLLYEIEYEVNKSINELNFEKLNKFINHLKIVEKEKYCYENIKKMFNDIDLNKKVQNIIQNEQIILYSNADKNYNQFFKSMKEKNKNLFLKFFFKNKKPKYYYNTIFSFIHSISNIKLNVDNDIYEEIKNKNIPEIIDNYLMVIKNHLENRNYDNKTNDEITNEINDYIMDTLYKKLFPKGPNSTDINIYENCNKHIWVDLCHLKKENNNYIFGDNLADIINYFHQFDCEKSPRKQCILLKKIFTCMYNLSYLNEGKNLCTDDALSLLMLFIIKSKPRKIYSNCNYIKLFIGKGSMEKIGYYLNSMIMASKAVEQLQFDKLYNISVSEYDLNCGLVSRKILY